MENDLVRSLRQQSGLITSGISDAKEVDARMFRSFLQDGTDVHGSHPLFYWLRSRGRGAFVSNGEASLALSWRPDTGCLVALRPVGDLEAMVDLLELLASVTYAKWPNMPLITRYCNAALAAKLIERAWSQPSAPWSSNAPSDDETYPEVVVTGDPAAMPVGTRYWEVRRALRLHGEECAYRATEALLNCGEADFIAHHAARVEHYGEHEKTFNASLLASLGLLHQEGLRYHYLFRHRSIYAFAVTGNMTGTTHGYYMGAMRGPRLATYFQWRIYLEERRRGAVALNFGGSETESLYLYKVGTFPDHYLQQTVMLQAPTSR
ncbi:hypothetical protein ACFRI7_20645 [Streptomyces sp. NPDC056716]|uniref:hypothetical protein n=1 Tax=unclassified Streptomyces TaxID=2593676 RepID=UPI0036923535